MAPLEEMPLVQLVGDDEKFATAGTVLEPVGGEQVQVAAKVEFTAEQIADMPLAESEHEVLLEEIVHVPMVTAHEMWMLEKRQQLASMSRPPLGRRA